VKPTSATWPASLLNCAYYTGITLFVQLVAERPPVWIAEPERSVTGG
jgi:hypothetical protein